MTKKLLITLLLCSTAFATVTGTDTDNIYTGDDGTVAFAFNFGIFSTSEVVVDLITTATRIPVTKAITTHYTVSATNNNYWTGPGGTVTMITAPASTEKLYIYRVPPLTQEFDLSAKSTFQTVSTKTFENVLDKIVTMIQYVNYKTGLSISIPANESGLTVELPNAVDRANEFIVFDASGNVTTTPATESPLLPSSLTDGGPLIGGGTGYITAMAVLADSEMIVGDGTTAPVAESGATLRTSIGVGTGDSPQLAGLNLGHATANTLTASGGVLSVEGVPTNVLFDIRKYGTNTTPGTTNMTSAIQAAVDAAEFAGGGIVLLQAETYGCGKITMKDNVTLMGSGWSTVLDAGSVTPREFLVATTDSQILISGVSNVQVRNLKLDGQANWKIGSAYSAGIEISGGSTEILIDNVYAFDQYYFGFHVRTSAENVTIQNCLIEQGCQSNAILVGVMNTETGNVRNVNIDNVIVDNMFGDGVGTWAAGTGVTENINWSNIIVKDTGRGNAIGTHNGGNNEATVMTDSTKAFVVDLMIGYTINNTTDGSSGTITDNDATSITVASLSGGIDNDWDTNDGYTINNITQSFWGSTDAEGVSLTNFQINGNTGQGHGIHTEAVERWTISNGVIRNIEDGYGINVSGDAKHCVFSNITVSDTPTRGMVVAATANDNVFNNITFDGANSGALIGGTRNTWIGCRWEDDGFTGYDAVVIQYNATDCIFAGNTIVTTSAAAGAGLVFSSITSCRIFGNTITGTFSGGNITGYDNTKAPPELLSSIELGHVSDTTISRASAGNINIEGNIAYRAGGTDVPVTDGGTGSSTAAGAASALGVGTGNTPQFTGTWLGHTASIGQEADTASWTPTLQANKANNGGIAMTQYSDTVTNAAYLWLSKNGTSTIRTTDLLDTNEDIGAIYFSGSDGATLTNAAKILVEVDGAPGSNNMPGRMSFWTTAAGAATPTKRVEIGSDGLSENYYAQTVRGITKLGSDTDNQSIGATGIRTFNGAAYDTNIQLGHASDTTIARAAAGQIAVAGKEVAIFNLSGSTTWDPGSIAAGAMEAIDITVTGAALGNHCVVSFSLDVTDLTLTANVTATNVVTAVLANNTAGAVDLDSGTIATKVFK